MRAVFVTLLVGVLSACASGGRAPDEAAVALRLPSFTATAPPARGWILTPGTAMAQAAVRSVGDTRTLVAFASEGDLQELTGADSVGALDRALGDIRASYGGGRHRLLSFQHEDAETGCRGYRAVAEDTAVPDRAGRLYVVTARGKVCVLPERNIVARLEYSDRRVEDAPPLPEFEQEAKAFLESLSVPGV
jgi:hypothetical protein